MGFRAEECYAVGLLGSILVDRTVECSPGKKAARTFCKDSPVSGLLRCPAAWVMDLITGSRREIKTLQALVEASALRWL